MFEMIFARKQNS